MRRGNFEGEGAAHYKVQGHSAVICAKTAESIEILFGLYRLGLAQGMMLLDGVRVQIRPLESTDET